MEIQYELSQSNFKEWNGNLRYDVKVGKKWRIIYSVDS